MSYGKVNSFPEIPRSWVTVLHQQPRARLGADASNVQEAASGFVFFAIS